MAPQSLHPDSRSNAAPEVAVAVDAPAAALQRALESGRADVALPLLNARTQYRFTAVHRFDELGVRCVLEFDRDARTVVFCERRLAPKESYSSVVQHSGEPFYTEAAEYDARLLNHPARSHVRAYAGVPLRDTFGRVIGALCHYDSRARPVARTEVETLKRVTPVAERWLR